MCSIPCLIPKNTFLRYGRTSNKAWWLINELRNTNQEDPLYDIIAKSTVYNLLSDYLDQILNQEILLEKVVKEDLVAIIDSQSFLLNLIESAFPGIKDLAARAMMSETKYKTLFRKITGLSPNAFFYKTNSHMQSRCWKQGNTPLVRLQHIIILQMHHILRTSLKNFTAFPQKIT